MQAEIEPLQVLEPGEILQLLIGVQAASRGRVPTRTGQIELAQIRQRADPFHVIWIDERAGQVHPGNPKFAGWQIRKISQRSSIAVDHQPATLANDPLACFPLRRRQGEWERQQPGAAGEATQHLWS